MAALLELQVKLTYPTLDKIFSHLSSLEGIGVLVEHHFSHMTMFTLNPLNSTVVPMTQERIKRTTKETMSSHSIVFNECLLMSLSSRECLHKPPLSSMSSHIFRGHIWKLNRICEELLPVLSCNSHKHISPSTRFVVNTPLPTGGGTRRTYTPNKRYRFTPQARHDNSKMLT